MRHIQLTTGIAAALLAAGCAAAPGHASGPHPATGTARVRSPGQVHGERTVSRPVDAAAPHSGGSGPLRRPSPAWDFCEGGADGGGTAAAPAGNGRCRPYLLVPAVVRHPKPGQRRGG